ncbi:MAG: hypothetical protein L6Q57_08515 [Alphaproteobacteria bacterium]|nr:hypothetical protein [Alphaproteobacteria bacterium]
MSIKSVIHTFNCAARGTSRTAKAAFNKAADFIERRIPAYVPRDKTTRRPVATGTLAYLCDIWDPFPIGESIAIACASLATLRGAYLLRGKRIQNPSTTPIQTP